LQIRIPKYFHFKGGVNFGINGEHMTHKFSLALLLWLLLISPQLASCAGGSPVLPVKEADFSVRNQQPFWLDNTHVLFYGYTGSEGVPGKDFHYLNEGLYVWDIERGTVTKDARFEHAHPECINGQTRSYVLRSSSDGKTSKRRAYINGDEVPLPDRVWVNPVSCHALTTLPPWVLDGHTSSSKVPLHEEHGYIDRGPDGEDRRSKLPMLYYRTGATEPMSLGLESRRVDPLVTYYPFADAYLLRGERGTYNAPPLWFLHPTGTVEQIFNPDGKAWAKQSWAWLVLTKRGPVFASLHAAGPHSSEAGLYLWDGSVLTPLRQGFFSWGVVSPDGCQLAFSAHNRGKDVSSENRFKLKIVDVCQGGNHGN
jgi:hypothetical protein